MSYRENWLRHLTAIFNAEVLSNKLASDSWASDEDLFSVMAPIERRWLKLIWVFCVSVFAQITPVIVIAGAAISLFKPVWLFWVLVVAGAASSFMLIFATAVASLTYFDIVRASRRSDQPKT